MCRADGEPLVHRDDRPVILLDLLFPQGKGGDEGDVEVLFYGHGKVIVCFRRFCNEWIFLLVKGNVGGLLFVKNGIW
jgi:hypothetical protein